MLAMQRMRERGGWWMVGVRGEGDNGGGAAGGGEKRVADRGSELR